jgi:ABC-type nitrate/sulfonate/bicarbonate transport system permease component
VRVRITRWLAPLVLLAALLTAWELWVRMANVEPAVFAPPSMVAKAMFDHAGTLARHAGTTLAETAIGLLVGTTVGLLIAATITTWPLVRRAVEPLLVTLQTVPAVVLAPILVLALGFGWAPRIAVVIGVVLFPVAIAAAGAFAAADPVRTELVRSFGGSRWDEFRVVVVPGALPAIFDGLRISAAYAFGSAAIAEQIGGARSGLGLFIARSQRNFRSDQVLAGVVVIALMSLAIYALVGWVARRSTPWMHTRTETR